MAPPGQQPNAALAHWVSRSGASHQKITRTIRAVAVERGHRDIAPDRSRVPRWIKGENPRPPLPDLIAEALNRLCGPRPG